MPPKKKVRIVRDHTTKELAAILDLNVVEVIKVIFMQGLMRTVDQIVEVGVARQLAVGMGYELVDDDEPPDEHGAAVPKKPILPEGGDEISLSEPE